MNRLHVKRLRSIGAVEAGDNPEADILLWKSKPTEPDQGQNTKGEPVSKIDLSALDPEVRSHIEDLETKLAGFETEDSPPLPDDLPDVVKARLDAQDAKIEAEEIEKEALREEIAKLREDRAVEVYTKMAQDLSSILGDPTETMPMLKAIGEAAPEPAAELVAKLEAFSSKTAVASLLKEYGSSEPDGSAIDQIEAIAAEIRKAEPSLSPAEARAEAWRRNPELKTQAREEGVV